MFRRAIADKLARLRSRCGHARIAEALEAQSPELMDTQPELLAQHYAEAGLVEKSVTLWGEAGRRSVARSAMVEAAAQLQKGLDQLALLPNTPERQRAEIEFHTTLGAVLDTVKGQAAPETGRAFARARELWAQLGFPSEFLRVPYGQSGYHAMRGELDLALGLGGDCVRWHKDNEASRRLATIPGVGPITASAIVATITDPFQFHSARHLAAWIGLVPRQHSSGGKQRQRGDFQTGRSLPAPITRAGCDRGDPAFAKHLHSRGWLAQEPARTPARTARLGGTG